MFLPRVRRLTFKISDLNLKIESFPSEKNTESYLKTEQYIMWKAMGSL